MIHKKHPRRSVLKGLINTSVFAAFGMFSSSIASAKEVKEYLKNFKGVVIDRLDASYEVWRSSMVWYFFKPERYPNTIFQVKNVKDVVEAVNYARDSGRQISIRSTGHHITCNSLRSGGVLISLSDLNSIDVDVDNKTAWIGPGVRSIEFANKLEEYGLMFPTAHTAVVGLGGFLLGGGLGWNLQELGVSCHSVIAAEIVTADGRVIVADEDNNTDLLWALRGAGATFFGIVTRIKVKVYSLPKGIAKNVYIFEKDKIQDVTAILDGLVPEKDKRVEVLTVLKHAEDMPPVSDKKGVVFVLTLISFIDDEKDIVETLDLFEKSRLKNLAIFKKERIKTTIAELYNAQSITDATSSFRTTSENIWTDFPSKALIKLADHFESTPSKKSFVLAVYGVKGFENSNTSLPYFADNYVVSTLVADNEKGVSENFLWMDKANNLIDPLMVGRYINEVEVRRYPDHVRDCFTEENWLRLKLLRSKYDPQNLFFDFNRIS